MSKKVKKPNISLQALERARQELYGEESTSDSGATMPTPENAKTTAQTVKAATRASKSRHALTIEDLKAEYGHVINDLRSMALLAISLFIGMVIVSLVLNQIS